jgi:beta-lactamase class A
MKNPDALVSRRQLIAGIAAGVPAALVMGCGSPSTPLPAPSPRASGTRLVPIDLSGLEARHGGRLGACIADSEGRSAMWRPDERFTYCSTFKLFLAAATLQRVDRGEERLDRAVPIRREDMLRPAPVTEPAVGSSLTIGRLCEGTVQLSDNPAANILIREMGGLPVWQRWFPSIGDRVTRVDRMEPDLNLGTPGDPRDTTTPRQTVINLATLLAPATLTDSSRDMLLEWMAGTVTGPNRILAAMPPGYRLGHKTGTGEHPVNDIGIIWPPSGGLIRIALYFSEAMEASMEQKERVLADATRLLLRALGHG